ncbi:MAG: hypothetical protein KAQ74_00655 [Dehalococcoidia bacterium]|nr:hypothetical protein [Dehalococcoidia bacterium]
MKHVLFICDSNTCRSPIATTVLERILVERGLQNSVAVDSAAYAISTNAAASEGARKVVTATYGSDLLAQHQPKRVSKDLLASADLILTMEKRQVENMPPSRTCLLREYAGSSGDIEDPAFSQDYEDCIRDIRSCVEAALPTLLLDLELSAGSNQVE